MIAEQLSIDDAIAARQRGMSLALLHADGDYREALMRAIRTLADSGVRFTSDEARALAGDPPAGCSPNVAGAIFNAAAKAGFIEADGFARSGRVIGHGNRVIAWRGRR